MKLAAVYRVLIFSGFVAAGVFFACQNQIVSPFFLAPSLIDNPDYPVSPLTILTGGDTVETDSCRVETSRSDSLLFLDIKVGALSPERIGDHYVKILLEVSVGLKDTGIVISDTAGIELPDAGDYPLSMRVENAHALSAGANRIAITAITRFLDSGGNLAAPLGRELRYCTLDW